jgi:hypothetical protein
LEKAEKAAKVEKWVLENQKNPLNLVLTVQVYNFLSVVSTVS